MSDGVDMCTMDGPSVPPMCGRVCSTCPIPGPPAAEVASVNKGWLVALALAVAILVIAASVLVETVR